MNVKIIIVGAVSFLTGAVVSAVVTRSIVKNKADEEAMTYYQQEVNKFVLQYKDLMDKRKEKISKPKSDVEILTQEYSCEDVDVSVYGDFSADDEMTAYKKYRDSYNKMYQRIEDEKNAKIQAAMKEYGNPTRESAPMEVADYETLVAMVPHGHVIYEWIYYSNFKGGVVLDCGSDMPVLYQKILQIGKRELDEAFRQGNNAEKYFYIPADGIGAVINIEPVHMPDPGLPWDDYASSMFGYPDDEEDDEYEDDEEDGEYDPCADFDHTEFHKIAMGIGDE